MKTRPLHDPCFAFGMLVLTACGAAMSDAEDSLVNPSSDAGDDVVLVDAADGGEDAGSVVNDAGRDPFDDWTDPSSDAEAEEEDEELVERDCTDAGIPPAPPSIECDIFAPPGETGCPTTSACIPYVIKAEHECGQPSYGTRCVSSGGRAPGQSCQFSGDCVQGSVCLVTTTGRKCGKACRLDDFDACEEGLVCMPVDEVPNLGGCL